MDGHATYMQKMMIFQQILRFLQKHYQRTDRQTDRRTDRRTDIPSYRDAIAASKKNESLGNSHWRLIRTPHVVYVVALVLVVMVLYDLHQFTDINSRNVQCCTVTLQRVMRNENDFAFCFPSAGMMKTTSNLVTQHQRVPIYQN